MSNNIEPPNQEAELAKPPPPPHLLGEMHRAWLKAVHATSRMHHCRKHRPKFYKYHGSTFAVGKSRWTTAQDKWQKRFQKACDRLEPYAVWKVAELTP